MIGLEVHDADGRRSLELTAERVAFGPPVEGAEPVSAAGWPAGASVEIVRVGPRHLVFDTGAAPSLLLDGRPVRRAELAPGSTLAVGPVRLVITALDGARALPPDPRSAVICYSPATGAFYAESGRPARLRVEAGPDAGLEALVAGNGLTIGREAACDLRLTDPKISGRHCRIDCAGGEYVLRDEGSRNGTFAGSRRVSAEVLAEGDEFRIGASRLRFLPFGPPEPGAGDRPAASTAADELVIFRVPQVLAHEIRNYLSVVGLSCERLAEMARARDGRVPTALRNIAAARGQIEHLLGLLRLASSEPRLADADLACVLAEHLALAEPELNRAGMRVEIDVERPLPARLDARQIGQVILNLLRNACQAAAGGRVRLSARRTGPALRLEIADDGPGIPEADRERVFTPFATTKPEGTGLGLYVSREIVRRHGGQLVLEEAPKGGALAVITLPA